LSAMSNKLFPNINCFFPNFQILKSKSYHLVRLFSPCSLPNGQLNRLPPTRIFY
jgi:hypothetical protein